MGIGDAYSLNDFKAACRRKKRVIATKDALRDAEMTFNLKTQDEVLDFIGNDGLQDQVLKNRKLWEKNPNPELKIMVDAYTFKNGGIPGYIAFYYNPLTKNWIIKSFKLNRESSFPLWNALSAFDIRDIPKRLKGDKDEKIKKE